MNEKCNSCLQNVFVLHFFTQQFKKAVTDLVQNKEWEVKSTTRAGKIRGYTGIKLVRPRKEPAIEFGGQIMRERLQEYKSFNPKPQPPIEVSIYNYINSE